MTPNGCAFCGAVADLTTRPLHVGGRGYEQTTECADKPACWMRQDALAKPVALKRAA